MIQRRISFYSEHENCIILLRSDCRPSDWSGLLYWQRYHSGPWNYNKVLFTGGSEWWNKSWGIVEVKNGIVIVQFYVFLTIGQQSSLRINETHINIIKLITKCAKVFHFYFPVFCPRPSLWPECGGQSSSSSLGVVFDKKCKLKAIYFHLV